MNQTELQYCVAFRRVPATGTVRIRLLLERYGSLEEARATSSSSLKDPGLDSRAMSSLTTVRSKVNTPAEMERLEKVGIRAIPLDDPDYLPRLKKVYDLP